MVPPVLRVPSLLLFRGPTQVSLMYISAYNSPLAAISRLASFDLICCFAYSNSDQSLC